MSTSISKISLTGVTKLFGTKRALYDVSFDVVPGDVVGLIGQNGAGKSTLLSILSTMTKPTFGVLTFNGENASPQLRAQIGYLSHKSFLYPELTCKENLELFAALYNVSADALGKLEQRFSLSEFFNNRPVGVLSRGQLQRVALARTLIASPDILLLDEPSSGLDRKSIGMIEEIVSAHQDAGGITFVVSHDPAMVASLCNRVLLLQMGELTVQADQCTTEEITKMLLGEKR